MPTEQPIIKYLSISYPELISDTIFLVDKNDANRFYKGFKVPYCNINTDGVLSKDDYAVFKNRFSNEALNTKFTSIEEQITTVPGNIVVSPTLTDGGNIVIDWSLGTQFELDLTGVVGLNYISIINAQQGKPIMLLIKNPDDIALAFRKDVDASLVLWSSEEVAKNGIFTFAFFGNYIYANVIESFKALP